jgi:DMSO/TMAO reductase YedYZ molybdopterin-dependent catalytic subunit
MDEKGERILEARLKLRARFLEKMRQRPAPEDERPLGSGAPNRHGLPRLPVGQTETTKWPVLDLGHHPEVPLSRWRLGVDGAVEQVLDLDWEAFLALPQIGDQSDFHCVTGWSRFGLSWRGVRMETVLALARPRPEASHVLLHGFDGYTTNLPLEEALQPDVLLAHQVDGGPLPVEHGGPVRVVTPQLYAWKGAKWVQRIELLVGDRRGYWERNGYSNTARPWRNDRYDR